jgi:predicted Zn-dependent protease with MMP-like domain
MERERFEELVGEAVEQLPQEFQAKLQNIAIIVEDFPPPEMRYDGLLLGLFHGIPRTEKSVFFSAPPDRIFLYQKNMTRKSRGRFVRHYCTKSGTTLD